MLSTLLISISEYFGCQNDEWSILRNITLTFRLIGNKTYVIRDDVSIVPFVIKTMKIKDFMIIKFRQVCNFKIQLGRGSNVKIAVYILYLFGE